MILSCNPLSHFPITADTPIAIAVSGGADSLYLAIISKEYCDKHQIPYVVLTVDHGLRPESKEESLWLKQYLESLGFKVVILEWQGKKPTSNIQEIAREARYDLLLNYCHKNSIKFLLTGHTQDDQAETIMLRIERGSGIDGLTGIKESSMQRNIAILRPLLHTKRRDIEESLKAKGLSWVNDPSNENKNFSRVKIRKMLHGFENYNMLLNRVDLMIANLRRSQDFIEQEVENIYRKICIEHSLFYYSILLKDFVSLHEEIKLRILKKILMKTSGIIVIPRLKNLLNILKSIDSRKKFCITSHGCEILLKDEKIFFYRELKVLPKDIVLDASNIIWDNRFNIEIKLNSVSLGPLGMEGYSKIRKHIEMPYAPSNKIYFSLPTIRESGKIIAIANILHSEHVEITLL